MRNTINLSLVTLLILTLQGETKFAFSSAMPAFMTMSPHAMLEQLSMSCPNLLPAAYAPTCPLGLTGQITTHPEICDTTNVTISLWLEKFHEIDSSKEAFVVSGSVTLTWNVPCTKYRIPSSDIGVNIEEAQWWHPKIIHKNTREDYGLSLYFSSRFLATGPPDNDTVSAAQFFLQHAGVFSSSCSMDLAMFPFDEQEMRLEFGIRENYDAVAFKEANITGLAADFISTGSEWLLANYSYSLEYMYISGSNRSVVVFKMNFRRRPEYYVYNIVLPTSLLASLELASFAMPTKLPDCPVFTMTILLALTVLDAQTVDKIPPKPQHFLLVNFSDLMLIFSWLCTIHSLVSCGIQETKNWRKWWRQDQYFGAGVTMRRCRMLDLMAFVIAFVFFIGAHIYLVGSYYFQV